MLQSYGWDAAWIPRAGSLIGPLFPTDQFTITASDGTSSGPESENISITIAGSTDVFGSYRLGTLSATDDTGALLPPTQVDFDPGAGGDVNEIDDPDYAWNTWTAVPDDYAKLALMLAGNYFSGGWATPEAQAAMSIYLSNPPANTHVPLDVRRILQKSQLAHDAWEEAINQLVLAVDAREFVGTIDLVAKEAHLGNTGDSDYGAAVGQYSGWGAARVTGAIVQGKLQYTVEFTYHIWDPYDWDLSRGGLQGELARMHLVGLARQYMTSGAHQTTFNWIKDHPPTNMPLP